MKKIIKSFAIAMALVCIPMISYARVDVNFQGHVDLSADFTSKMGGPALDAVAGARITDYFFAGVGLGYHTLMGDTKYTVGKYTAADVFVYNQYLPVFANLKGYYPMGSLAPYVDLSLGGLVGLKSLVTINNNTTESSNREADGLYLRVGLGIDWNRFNFGGGYQLYSQTANDVTANTHMGYFKIGYRF